MTPQINISPENAPLISVVVPAYNAGSFIRETLVSALAPTLENIEVIVINDGSKDNTGDVVRELQATDNRLKLIEKSNSGVSDSRNAGLKIARGEYIAFLDADDIWLPENLQTKLATLSKTGADAVYSPCAIMDETGSLTGAVISGSMEPQLDDLLLFRSNYLTAPSALMVKRAVVEAIGDFDPKLSNNADQDFWIRLLAGGFKLVRTEATLWHYRVHGSNMSSNIHVLEKDSLYLFNKMRKNGVYPNRSIQRNSMALLYRMLAGSWMKQGNNKARAVCFLLRAALKNPLVLLKSGNK